MFINYKNIIIIITMPLMNIYFDEEEDEKINTFSKKWKYSKTETLKKIVRNFKEE